MINKSAGDYNSSKKSKEELEKLLFDREFEPQGDIKTEEDATRILKEGRRRISSLKTKVDPLAYTNGLKYNKKEGIFNAIWGLLSFKTAEFNSDGTKEYRNCL